MKSVTVHFLNVGHGDCTIIEHASGRLTMIDINNSQSLPDEDVVALAANKGLSINQFRSRGYEAKSWQEYYEGLLVDPVEYCNSNFSGRTIFRYIQTHPDMDHMGGLAELFFGQEVPLINFWDTSNSKSHVKKDFDNSPHNWTDWRAYELLQEGTLPNHPKLHVHRKTAGAEGTYWTDDGLTLLSPSKTLAEYCDRIGNWNNVSQVFRLSFGGRRLILPGDAEEPAWDWIEANWEDDDLSCDILKAAHHGRDSGYSESAVDAMAPSAVICSVGKKPDSDASDEYRSHGAKVFSTRSSGTMKMTMWEDGEVWLYNRKSERVFELPPLET